MLSDVPAYYSAGELIAKDSGCASSVQGNGTNSVGRGGVRSVPWASSHKLPASCMLGAGRAENETGRLLDVRTFPQPQNISGALNAVNKKPWT